ncbi:class I SAM-dependent methyltransferase [Streptosporangium sp. NPDC023615]|uniref:class I SAM-dependent methyltransferase n=1 Tax=Streptosporangium sp. NPDC023615 TaxID=3154794 RepID=UPI003424AC37
MFAERALSRVVYGSRYDRVPRNQRSYVRPGERLAREVRWRLRIGRTPVLRYQDYRERILLEGAERFVTCRLCGETRQQPLFQRAGAGRGGNYRVVRCPACGLLYRNPAVRPAATDTPATGRDLTSPAVRDLTSPAGRDLTPPAGRDLSPVAAPVTSPPATRNRGERGRPADRRRRYRLTMDAFGPVFSSGHGRRLLDVGRGGGLFPRLAEERGFEVTGLDLPAGSVAAATARADAGGFDVITLWSVLARLPRPLEDLGCLRGLLAPGGVLLILTANAASLQLKAYGSGWRGFTRNGLMFYSAETLAALLSRTGFAGVAFAPFYGDDVEAGAVGLPGRMDRRLRRNVETGGGKMLRALAFADEEAIGRWSERLGARSPT